MNLPSPKSESPLLLWLIQVLAPMKRTRVKHLLAHGRVQVNGVAVTRHDHPVTPADRVTIGEPNRGTLPILFEDAAMIAIDKPPGLLSVATDAEKIETAFVKLSAMLPRRPTVVHRLDRETSGVLLFARSMLVRDSLQAQWDRVEKTYLAVVAGRPPASGIIDNHLLESKSLKVRPADAEEAEAKRAISRYRVLKPQGSSTLVEVTIETGRKHQIRVHLASLGFPIVGDTLYGGPPAKRMMLHAHRLRLNHPLNSREVVIESPAAFD